MIEQLILAEPDEIQIFIALDGAIRVIYYSYEVESQDGIFLRTKAK
jgi:hypothetical protein